MKGKKGNRIANVFQEFLEEFNRKSNKIWIDICSEFCNKSMKSWLQDSDIKVYSTHYEGKFVVAERFIRTLRIESTNTWLQFQKMSILIN